MEKTYTIVPDFLLDYDLSLVETVALAVIYGFCQDGKSDFHGSYNYIARKCKVARRSAMRIVDRLAEKGYIRKEIRDINGVRSCSITTTFRGGDRMSPVVTLCHRGGDRVSPGGGDPASPNNIYRDNIDEKIVKPISFSFLNSLKALGVSEKYASEWMQVRRTKRLTNTETAFARIKAEIQKSGRSADDCIRTAVENSWGGFKAEWMPKQTPKYEYWGDIEGYIKAKNNGTLAQ